MLLQQSRFTIHNSTRPLQQFDGAEQFLDEFVIPAPVKPAIAGQLRRVGISRSTLFPDLRNLAQDIAQMSWHPAPEMPPVAALQSAEQAPPNPGIGAVGRS
jgi:hypothetical protein